jgi:DNA-binding LacI/PurR family transcriptional regulator
LDLGHRYFAQFVFAHGIPLEVQRRIDGIRAALADRGFTSADHLTLYPMDNAWNDPHIAPHTLTEPQQANLMSTSEQEFVDFLRAQRRVTAIFGINDACVLHAWRALHLSGYHIPEDYSLIGYDDTDPMLNADKENLLSSVQIPLQEIGKEAAHLCVRLVKNPALHRPSLTLPSTFIPRASIGPACSFLDGKHRQ